MMDICANTCQSAPTQTQNGQAPNAGARRPAPDSERRLDALAAFVVLRRRRGSGERPEDHPGAGAPANRPAPLELLYPHHCRPLAADLGLGPDGHLLTT